MAQQAEEEYLMQNVRDLRRRLFQTEQSLHSLTVLDQNQEDQKLTAEADISLVNADDTLSQNSSPGRAPALRLEDLTPEGSTEVQSQPAIHHGYGPGDRDNRGSWPGLHRPRLMTAEEEPFFLQPRPFHLLEDANEVLKQKLYQTQEENVHLVAEKHRLLCQIEDVSNQFHETRVKLQQLHHGERSHRQQVSDLEEKIISLEGEIEAQDKALRCAEQRYDTSEQQLGATTEELNQVKTELEAVKEELSRQTDFRRRADKQRDSTSQQIEELQATLEEYQRKTKDKLKKYQSLEDELRDSLQGCEQEKDRLFQNVADLTVQLTEIQAANRTQKIRSANLQERKEQLEQENLDQQRQLARQAQHIGKLEADIQSHRMLEKDNQDLQGLVQQQRLQLSQCQREISHSATQLLQLEQLAQRLQQQRPHLDTSQVSTGASDSGLGFGRTRSGDQGRDQWDAGPGCHDNSASVIAELRQQVANRDSEIKEILSGLLGNHTSASSSSHALMDQLRTSLTALIEKNKMGETRSQEMQEMLKQLEEERSRHASRILSLEEKLSKSGMEHTSLQGTLQQYKSQLEQLQQEANERVAEVAGLEREVRKKSSQLSTVEGQLDEKVSLIMQHVSKVKDMEEELSQKEAELSELRISLEESEHMTQEYEAETEGLKKAHQEQYKELQDHLELTQNEEKITQIKELEQNIVNLKLDMSAKDQSLSQVQQILESRSQEDGAVITRLKQQASMGTSQVQELESALVVCKEELNLYLDQLEQVKGQYEEDSAVKSQQITNLQETIQRLRDGSEERAGQVSELTNTVDQQQQMLQQSDVRVGQLEEVQAQLETQLSRQEQLLQKERAAYTEELQALQRKLQQASTDLQQRTADLQQLSSALNDLQAEKGRLVEEVEDLEEQLHQTREEAAEAKRHLTDLEAELTKFKCEGDSKAEQVAEKERQIQRLETDLQEKSQRCADLDSELIQTQGALQQSHMDQTELQHLLERSAGKLKEKDEQMEDLKQTLRRNQDELRSRAQEMEELEQAIKDRHWQLQQRAAQVTKLDMLMKEHQSDTEQQLIQVDSKLKKAQFEAQQKGKQLAEVSENLQQTQDELHERSLQLQQVQQHQRHLQRQLESKKSQTVELEKQVSILKQRSAELKEDHAETTQELRLTREQSQQQHVELGKTKQELTLCQQEQDRLAKQLEDTLSLSRSKDCEVARVQEELDRSHATEAQMESRMAAEVRRIKKDMDLLKEQHRHEIEELRESHAKIVASKEDLGAQYRIQVKDMTEKEQRLLQQLEHITAELSSLQGELLATKDMVDTANETIVLKEAEIARLEARMSSHERSMFGKQAAALSLGGSPQSLSGHRMNTSPNTSLPLLRHSLGIASGDEKSVKKESPTSCHDLTSPKNLGVSHQCELNDSWEEYISKSHGRPGAASSPVKATTEVCGMLSKIPVSKTWSNVAAGIFSGPEDDPGSFTNMLRQVSQQERVAVSAQLQRQASQEQRGTVSAQVQRQLSQEQRGTVSAQVQRQLSQEQRGTVSAQVQVQAKNKKTTRYSLGNVCDPKEDIDSWMALYPLNDSHDLSPNSVANINQSTSAASVLFDQGSRLNVLSTGSSAKSSQVSMEGSKKAQMKPRTNQPQEMHPSGHTFTACDVVYTGEEHRPVPIGEQRPDECAVSARGLASAPQHSRTHLGISSLQQKH